mmetsp:Transcript_19826/g.35875  ORF Transcript_19826/g.35875 Transcript_19826/m.35875 type:complete len:327 (+) Transcript_19826:59-1039(+)
MLSMSARSFAIVTALIWAPATCFVPTISVRKSPLFQTTCRTGLVPPRAPVVTFLQVEQSSCNHDLIGQEITSEKKGRRGEQWRKMVENRRNFIIGAAVLFATIGAPSPCSASSILSHIPSPNDLKVALVSILDGLSHSGTKGMVVYTMSFILWTMTFGATTPIETAAGMAFPLQKSIPLSAIGKTCGAFFQYVLAKYLFADYARKKMKGNEWMDKINASFQSHPYRVALIWRFSPLPEFMKNIGPALVPTLRTPYQILAILTHGLPFTVLWSCMGREAAMVARGGQASLLFKRMVTIISGVGLVVSPTLFGMWVKGLGASTEESDS